MSERLRQHEIILNSVTAFCGTSLGNFLDCLVIKDGRVFYDKRKLPIRTDWSDLYIAPKIDTAANRAYDVGYRHSDRLPIILEGKFNRNNIHWENYYRNNSEKKGFLYQYATLPQGFYFL